MKCISDKVFLDYINQELSTRKEKNIISHIQKCARCKKRLLEWEKTVNITEDFVKEDINKIEIPDIKFDLNRCNEYAYTIKQEKQNILKLWWKPAIATALVVLISLSFLFFPQQQKKEKSGNYLVYENEYFGTSAIELNKANLSLLEKSFWEDIFKNDDLESQLINNTEYSYYDFIENLSRDNIELLEKEIDELKKYNTSTKPTHNFGQNYSEKYT